MEYRFYFVEFNDLPLLHTSMLLYVLNSINQNAQDIPTHSQLTTSHYNRRNACALCADAHLCSLALFVRGGDGECRAEYVFCSKERCKIIKKCHI